MEDCKDFVPLQREGTEILKHCCSAFCRALEGKFGCTAQIHFLEDHAASSFGHSKATFVPEIKYSKQLSNNVMVSVWKDDLTTHKADAVVNAANMHLSHGAGLALSLRQAGGPQIQRQSDDIIKFMGPVPTGEVVATPAGNLPCNMIIHAVGPCVSHNPTKAEFAKASHLLDTTISNILLKAISENLSSVAIPAISSGIYNFPLQKCAEIIVKAVKTFSDRHKPGARSLEIRLVNNDDPSVQQMQKACLGILGRPDPMPTQNPGSAPSQSVLISLDLGNVTLHLKKSAIEDEKTDVIVNTIGADLDLSKGQVSGTLLHKAGRKIQDEIKQHTHGSDGGVIATGGYKLNCKAVFHTVCVPRSSGSANKIIYSVVTDCLTKARIKGYSSISFPALGTGNLGLEKDEVAQIMTKAALDFSKNCKDAKMQIFFVIFPKDTRILKAFEKTMASSKAGLQTSKISRSTSAKSSGFYASLGSPTVPGVELFAPSAEALREAKHWSYDMLHFPTTLPPIYNNHIVHLSQEDHKNLLLFQTQFDVIITEFFKKGKGGLIIKGNDVGVRCAALKVEAMLCDVQEDFARSEEKDMQSHMHVADDSGQRQQNDRMSNMPYQKTPISTNSSDWIVKERRRIFEKCGLSIVKMEKIENDALKQIFTLNSKRIKVHSQPLYQCVKAQFCDLICRVGFQREYSPPKEQKHGAGIYFTTEVDTARSLWSDNGEEYVYVIEAQVLTGNEIRGSSEMIVPPPIGKDPLVRYDSVTNCKDIYVIFNGQHAYPKFLITCRKIY